MNVNYLKILIYKWIVVMLWINFIKFLYILEYLFFIVFGVIVFLLVRDEILDLLVFGLFFLKVGEVFLGIRMWLFGVMFRRFVNSFCCVVIIGRLDVLWVRLDDFVFGDGIIGVLLDFDFSDSWIDLDWLLFFSKYWLSFCSLVKFWGRFFLDSIDLVE